MIKGEETDFLGMTDEEFLNLNEPASVGSDDESSSAPLTLDGGEGAANQEPEASAAEPTGSGVGETEAAPENPAPTTLAADPAAKADPVGEVANIPTDNTGPVEEAVGNEGLKTPSAEEAQAFFMQVMRPFKANGKMVELRSPDEAISLMQMGANYTRKMQELQPHRKTLLMLQNNNLLDADKLSFLIDLDRGDPEAVKKFIKDRGIDPLDIDTSTDPAYLGGNHQVSDEDVAFRTTLDELSSTPAGQETIQEIHSRWDNVSKEMLWKHPDLLSVIQEQRELGVYATISAEIERLQTLGKLRADMPFLEAYKIVGDQLVAESGVAQGQSEAPAPVSQTPQVLATRAAAPKSPAKNSDQVAAAAPTRGTPTAAQDHVNPLMMADDEFLKLMENRV